MRDFVPAGECESCEAAGGGGLREDCDCLWKGLSFCVFVAAAVGRVGLDQVEIGFHEEDVVRGPSRIGAGEEEDKGQRVRVCGGGMQSG